MELFKNSIQKITLFFNNILIGIALYTLTIQNIHFWDRTQIYDSLPFFHVLLTFLLILSTIKITLLLSDYLHIYTFNKENFSFLIVKPFIRGLLLILIVKFISAIFLFMENHFQYKNQYGYTINELIIDYGKKTYKIGNFNMFDKGKKITRKAFWQKVEELKMLDFQEEK